MAALMLKTVFEQTREKYQLKVLAGEEGLHRSLRWLYFSEDIENAAFLRGGELMVLTGHSFDKREEFEEFIKMLIEKNACGVIVNVGKYILEEEISEELLALCEESNFPLITMPWKYHLADVLQDYSRQVFFRAHEHDRLAYIFQTLLAGDNQLTSENETRLLANRFDPKGVYCVAVVSCQAKDQQKASDTIVQDMTVLAENHLNQAPEKVCVFPYKNQVAIVYHGAVDQQVANSLEGVLAHGRSRFPTVHFYGGIGTAFSGVQQLAQSYNRACAALLQGIYEGRGQMAFHQMGVFQLFFTCTDQGVLKEFTKVLEPLEAYDRQSGSQLVETLELYLKTNGSVNQVSEALYCHRNTTNYRIKKIRALLGEDLDGSDLRFRLQLAFHVLEFKRIHLTENE